MHFENVLLVFSETRKIEGSEQAIHLVTMFIGNKQRYVVYTHSLRKLLCTCSYTSIHVHKAVIIAGALPGPISSYKIGRGWGYIACMSYHVTDISVSVLQTLLQDMTAEEISFPFQSFK